jgi:hypothetical protein
VARRIHPRFQVAQTLHIVASHSVCFSLFLGAIRLANATLAKVHRDRSVAAPGIETLRREAHLRATSDLQKEVRDDERDRGDENGEDENGDDENWDDEIGHDSSCARMTAPVHDGNETDNWIPKALAFVSKKESSIPSIEHHTLITLPIT